VTFGISSSLEGTEFNFMVLEDIHSIEKDIQVQGQVYASEMTYYLYLSDCSECTISVQISNYTGFPELYVAKMKDYYPFLPSLTYYQFNISTL